MGEPTVECYNCGRENPAWAQICRTCGVSLRGADRFASGPPPRFPTDPNSIFSMVAAVGTIVAAIIVGLLLSNLDPGPATAGSPEPTPQPIPPSIAPPTSAVPLPTAEGTPAATPVPTPALPGELLIGTTLDPETRRVATPQEVFGPDQNFAYSVTMPEPIGAEAIFVEVARIEEDGTETVLQEPAGAQPIDPALPTAAFEIPSNNLIFGEDGTTGTGDDFGVGRFVMRIYLGPDQPIASAEFELTAAE